MPLHRVILPLVIFFILQNTICYYNIPYLYIVSCYILYYMLYTYNRYKPPHSYSGTSSAGSFFGPGHHRHSIYRLRYDTIVYTAYTIYFTPYYTVYYTLYYHIHYTILPLLCTILYTIIHTKHYIGKTLTFALPLIMFALEEEIKLPLQAGW